MNHDYAHCNGDGCSLRDKCVRYLLHLDAIERKIIHVATWIQTERETSVNFIGNEPLIKIKKI